MKSLKLLIPLFLIVFLVIACSKSEDGGNTEQVSAEQEQMEESGSADNSSSSAESEHFLSGQQRALEKAKGVDDMLQEAEQKRRKEIE